MRHRIKKTYSVQKDAASNVGSGSRFRTKEQQLNKIHLLHSDKSTNTDGGSSINTLFLGARHASPPSQGCYARPPRESGSPAKKVFTGRARTYFYKGELSGEKGFFRLKQLVCSFVNRQGSGSRQMDVGGRGLVVGKMIPLGLPVVSALVLLLVLGMMILPVGICGVDKVSAATTVPDPNFSIQFSMGETLNTEEELESGVVGYISNNFTVSTTSTSSYSIYLSPDTTNGYSNKLIGRDHKQEIVGVGNNVTVGVDFANNTWGYGLSNTNDTTVQNSTLTYSTIPDGSAPIKTVNNPDDGNDTYKLVFAAKINNEKPVDHYQSQAVLSVMASPKDVILTTLEDLTYMQEATLEICARSKNEETKQLIDGRDNKSYWVTKLAGTCWMTQDLDLDLQGMTITNKNDGDNMYKGSDVTSTWTGGNVASKESGWNRTDGDPTKNIEWWDRNTGDKANGAHQAKHDFLGNLYSFEAATAGTGSAVTNNGGIASGSICPAGWKLPLGGSNGVTGSFKGLEFAGMTSNTIANSSPYHFQYGGRINGSLYNVDTGGYYWSAMSSSNISAYGLFLNTSGKFVSNAHNNNRYFGYSVRCVVR